MKSEPDERGMFGQYGGRFVPEMLIGALDELEQSGELHGYQPYHAARADLSRRAGRSEIAKAEYRKAYEAEHGAIA